LYASNNILEVPILIMGMEGEFRAGIVPGLLSMSESEGANSELASVPANFQYRRFNGETRLPQKPFSDMNSKEFQRDLFAHPHDTPTSMSDRGDGRTLEMQANRRETTPNGQETRTRMV
jgi:hypothetical protein